MKHYGEIVAKKIRDMDLNISALAIKLDCSRQTLYEYFKTPNLSLSFIHKLGLIIKHDFTIDIPEMKDYLSTKGLGGVEEAEYWRNKYISLQDEYIKHLKEKSDETNKLMENVNQLLQKLIAKK